MKAGALPAIGGGLAMLALALACASQALWLGAATSIAVGLLWLLGQWRDWGWLAGVCLASGVALGAYGAWSGLPAGWLLASIVLLLAAWDLDHFFRQLRGVEQVVGANEITREHLRSLLLVAGAGLLLGLAALGLRLELGFGWALLLAGLAIFGLARIIGLVHDARK